MVALIFSLDLATDHRWDLANVRTFMLLLALTEQGFIDIWVGGPPCSTVSRARHRFVEGGPRPLRSRESFWGLGNLLEYENKRLAEANILFVHFMALCEAVSSVGGRYLWWHAVAGPLVGPPDCSMPAI